MSLSQSGGRSLFRVVQAALFVGLCTPAVEAQSAELVWSRDSDGSWIGENVALGDHGSQVFTRYGGFVGSTLLLSSQDTSPPAPVWDDQVNEWTSYRRVASSSDGALHVTMHQEDQASGGDRQAVLRCYLSDSPAYEWSQVLPISIPNHPYSDVRVSADGERLVAAVYDSSNGKTYVAVYASGSPVPIASDWISTLGAFRTFELSADGSTAVLASQLRIAVFDVDTLEVRALNSLSGDPNRGALGIGGDGSLIAYGSDEIVRLYERQTDDSYTRLDDVPLPQGLFCGILGVSRDGSTLVFGLNDLSNPLLSRIQTVDYPSRNVIGDYSVVGAGSFQNHVADIGVSSDGEVIAVGLFGDEAETVPELLFFQRGDDEPFYTHDLPGSVNQLDMSPSGDRVAVACKGTHANQFGGGGAIRLFNTHRRDFEIEGVPLAGSSVELVQAARPGTVVRTIASPLLGDQPVWIGGAGWLHLDRASVVLLPGTAVTGADGRASIQYDVPGSANLIGTTLYLQGLRLGPRELSRDWETLTILP